MKIKAKEITYDKFLEIKPYSHVKPKRRSIVLATVIRLASMLTLIFPLFFGFFNVGAEEHHRGEKQQTAYYCKELLSVELYAEK